MDEVRKAPVSDRRRFVDMLHERPELILSVLLFVVLIGGWELIVRVFDISRIIVPAPSAVIASLIDGLGSPNFLYHIWITFFETMAGFGLGASIGLFLGGIIGQFPLLERTLYPYVVGFQTIPKVAVAPIIVIWFGYGVSSKVVITATIAFFPVLANTIVGLRATPLDQLELLVAYTANRWQTFWKVKVPQALPYIFVGLDVAIVLSVIGAIVGEFVGAQAGLGYLIMQRNFSMDMAGTFAILVVLSVMGMALHGIMQAIQRRIVFWMEPAASMEKLGNRDEGEPVVNELLRPFVSLAGFRFMERGKFRPSVTRRGCGPPHPARRHRTGMDKIPFDRPDSAAILAASREHKRINSRPASIGWGDDCSLVGRPMSEDLA